MKGKCLLFAVSMLTAFSCSKKGDDTAPVITINSPTDNQIFAAAQVVNVTATINDNDEIHEVHLFVTNKATGAETLHFEDHADLKTYNLSKSFTTQFGITYKIKVEATDHSGNDAVKEIEVSSN